VVKPLCVPRHTCGVGCDLQGYISAHIAGARGPGFSALVIRLLHPTFSAAPSGTGGRQLSYSLAIKTQTGLGELGRFLAALLCHSLFTSSPQCCLLPGRLGWLCGAVPQDVGCKLGHVGQHAFGCEDLCCVTHCAAARTQHHHLSRSKPWGNCTAS
jgi:hypothetical protein